MTPSMNGEEKEKKHTGRKAALAIIAVVVVVAVIAAAAFRILVKKPALPNGGNTPGQITTAPPEDDQNEDLSGSERKSDSFYTVLIAGTDTSSDSTDTIMVASYDVANQKAAVISIPRDTLVNAFGTGRYTRINSVYAAYGKGEDGMEALTEEVAYLLGFRPDFRVFIDWSLVGELVDAIGGVEYDVPFHMEYDDPYQDLHIYVEKGLQTLDGAHAMQLVRWRKNNPGISSGGGTGSDLNRLNVQHGFLSAMLKQTLQIKNVTKITRLAALAEKHMDGDLTVENICWFATQAIFGGLSAENVEFATMPVLGANPYVYPDHTNWLDMVNAKLNPYVSDITIDDMDLIYFDNAGNLRSTGR